MRLFILIFSVLLYTNPTFAAGETNSPRDQAWETFLNTVADYEHASGSPVEVIKSAYSVKAVTTTTMDEVMNSAEPVEIKKELLDGYSARIQAADIMIAIMKKPDDKLYGKFDQTLEEVEKHLGLADMIKKKDLNRG